MISFNIGPRGRLGNQMFQYAALLGIADKQNCQYGINYDLGDSQTWREFGLDNRKDILSLNKCFSLSAQHTNTNYPEVIERDDHFHFQERFCDAFSSTNLHINPLSPDKTSYNKPVTKIFESQHYVI